MQWLILPLSAHLFIIYLEPFLFRLSSLASELPTLKRPPFGYTDDVQVLGDDLQDIVKVT
jgi:hypothetical protein